MRTISTQPPVSLRFITTRVVVSELCRTCTNHFSRNYGQGCSFQEKYSCTTRAVFEPSRAELGTVGFGSNTLLRSSNSARARVEFEINVRIRLVKNLAKFELGSNSVRFTSRDFNRARAARARLDFYIIFYFQKKINIKFQYLI